MHAVSTNQIADILHFNDNMYIKSGVSSLSLHQLFLFVSFINDINCFWKMIKFPLIFPLRFLAADFSLKLELLFLPQFWVFVVSFECCNQTLYRNFHKKFMWPDYYENLTETMSSCFSTFIKNGRIFTTRIIGLSSTELQKVGVKLLGIIAGT